MTIGGAVVVILYLALRYMLQRDAEKRARNYEINSGIPFNERQHKMHLDQSWGWKIQQTIRKAQSLAKKGQVSEARKLFSQLRAEVPKKADKDAIEQEIQKLSRDPAVASPQAASPTVPSQSQQKPEQMSERNNPNE